ncbi:hypothetical protein BVX98_08020 [bacterium F11]|nr:hypothetical protein BVX98_08020 [bacterium F11]
MQIFQEFFQLSLDILEWRFLALFVTILLLGLFLPKNWIQPFRSVRFNVGLFFVIAVASAVGTLLDIYHSWWFWCLLALMAFNVIVCKLRFHPLKKRKVPDVSLSHLFLKVSQREETFSHKKISEVLPLIRSVLKEINYRYEETEVHDEQKEKNHVFAASRFSFQRWGDFVLHVSIVGILAGNLLGALVGFDESLPIRENAKAQMVNRDYEIELKDFDIQYYEGSQNPSLYASDIIVRNKGQVVAQKKITVNNPLDIEGVRFYQAFWGMADEFRSAQLWIGGNELEIRPGESTTISGTPYVIRANSFLPTFDLDEQSRPLTRDHEGHNPALLIEFLEKGEVLGKVWILRDRPDLAFRMVGDQAIRTQVPPFRLREIDPVLFSGLQIGYDPGAPLFWIFSLMLLVGLCLHFYFHQRQLRVVVTSKKNGTRILIGGWNSRAPQEFQAEFDRFNNRLSQECGCDV